MAKTAASVQPATPAQPLDRKALRASALEQAIKFVIADGHDREIPQDELVDAVDILRDMVAAFSPKARVAGGPRVTLEKASPTDVASFFVSTGLTRKELAAAAGVSTSVIATVQNEKGDRWSTVTFEAKRALILSWMTAHAAEIEARKANEAAEAVAKQAAIDAKAQRKTAAAAKAAAPKVAKAKAPAAATTSAKAAPAKKPGRPSASARQANRKQPAQGAVAAQA